MTASVLSPRPPQDSLFAGPRAVATLTLALGIGSHAINGFVTSAVLPDIIRDLGGQSRAFWVFSAFEMAALLSGCVTGAVKVRFGARQPFLFATMMLAAGSALAGLSPSLTGLIAGRALQGFGEGLIIALCYALIPELYPKRMAGRVFTVLAGVWALAAGFGPVSAGVLSEVWSWRAAFLVNLPLTLLLFILINTTLPKSMAKRQARSGPGARRTGSSGLAFRIALLTAAVFLFTTIGEQRSLAGIGLALVAGLAVSALLIRTDRRAPIPFLPANAFQPATLVGLGTWIAMLNGFSSGARAVFVTTFAQVLWGLSVTQASYTAALLAVSWSFFAWVSARAPDRGRELAYLTAGPFLISLGIALTGLSVDMGSLPLFAAAAVIAGAGHGLSNQILMRSLMYNADGAERDLISSLLPVLGSAGIAIGAGLTGLTAVLTGLVDPSAPGLVSHASVEAAGAQVFYIFAALSLIPATAMLVLKRMIIEKEKNEA